MITTKRMGWRRDLPDFRDYTDTTPQVQEILSKSKPLAALQGASVRRSAHVDLRQFCAPVQDQGDLGSCTAHAGMGLLSYYQNRTIGHHTDLSRLFLYKVTRNLAGLVGDTGAELRTTMQAIVMLGAPPESYSPYNINVFDNEPTAFLYAMAQDYRGAKYYKLDTSSTPATNLEKVLTSVASGLPAMFGFTVYSSFPQGNGQPNIPMPQPGDSVIGGHAMDIVGYDDAQRIMIVRNSWGSSWGAGGYGYMPYGYVLQGIATDFWNLVQANYVDTALFQ